MPKNDATLKMAQCSIVDMFDDGTLSNVTELIEFLREADIFASELGRGYTQTASDGRDMLYGLAIDALRHVEERMQQGKARASKVLPA